MEAILYHNHASLNVQLILMLKNSTLLFIFCYFKPELFIQKVGWHVQNFYPLGEIVRYKSRLVGSHGLQNYGGHWEGDLNTLN